MISGADLLRTERVSKNIKKSEGVSNEICYLPNRCNEQKISKKYVKLEMQYNT